MWYGVKEEAPVRIPTYRKDVEQPGRCVTRLFWAVPTVQSVPVLPASFVSVHQLTLPLFSSVSTLSIRPQSTCTQPASRPVWRNVICFCHDLVTLATVELDVCSALEACRYRTFLGWTQSRHGDWMRETILKDSYPVPADIR
ncbi:unnamed protein product [Protopolystoma xenopodis]|uniref:Uncharacterized protein n=1 Tax=Protopolystoma xenopodis TaxID=117903 RepID=A0A3S5B6C2_9PLAT|nr:unnamed protein product [Protopolystoma xenopodis]